MPFQTKTEPHSERATSPLPSEAHDNGRRAAPVYSSLACACWLVWAWKQPLEFDLAYRPAQPTFDDSERLAVKLRREVTEKGGQVRRRRKVIGSVLLQPVEKSPVASQHVSAASLHSSQNTPHPAQFSVAFRQTMRSPPLSLLLLTRLAITDLAAAGECRTPLPPSRLVAASAR
jgi:hypothetical protein